MNEYIKIALSADPVALVAGFSKAEGAVQHFQATFNVAKAAVQTGGKAYQKFAGDIQSAGKKTLAAGMSLNAGLLASIKVAADFQTQMKNVQSLTRISDTALGKQSSQIMKMSSKLPQAPEELAAGLYDIASSGFEGAEGMEVLNRSAEAASAGMTTTAVASKAIVAVMNAYGLSAKDAADVSDILFSGVNKGVMTFEALAGSMGQWVGMASQMGIAADEAVSAVATMTLTGISADEASTYLSRLIESFVQPSEAMKKAATDSGYATAKLMLDAQGLGGALATVQKATKGDQTAFMDLFPSIQAARGAMAMLANDGKNWDRVSSSITDKNARGGETMRTYAIQAESLSAKWKMLWNNIKTIGIQIGSVFVKPLGFVVDMVAKILEALSNIPGPVRTMFVALAAATAAITTFVGVVGTFFAALIAKKVIFSMLSKGLLSLAASSALTGTKIAGVLAWLSKWSTGQGKIFSMLFGKFKAFASLISFVGKRGQFFGNMSIGAAALDARLQSVNGRFATMSNKVKGFTIAGALGTQVALGMAVGAYALYEGLVKANDKGKELAKTFAEGLDTDTWLGMKDSLTKIQLELDKTKQKLNDLGEAPGEMMSAENVFNIVNPFSDAEKDVEEAQGKYEELERQQKKIIEKQTKFRGLVTAAFMKREGMKVKEDGWATEIIEGAFGQSDARNLFEEKGHFLAEDVGGLWETVIRKVKETSDGSGMDPLEMFFGNGDDMKRGFAKRGAEMSKEFFYSQERMAYDMERIGKAAGISVEDMIKPGSGKKATEEVLKLYDSYRLLSPAAQQAKISFLEMGEGADDATTNIEKLEKALTSTLEAALGYEAARDSFQGLVNDVYKGVQDIKEAGTLSQAMDLNSMHEDALALRSDWRGLVQGLVEDTTSWAKSQGEVTGPQIEAHLADQIKLLQQYGAEMGLAPEFVNHYIESLRTLTREGAIAINFSDNTSEAAARAESYQLQLLKTPENVETFAFLHATEGEKKLREFLAQLGVVDETEVRAVIDLQGEAAYAELKDYVANLGLADEKKFIQTAIELSMKEDPNSKAVQEFLSASGVSQEDYQVIVGLIGDVDSEQRLTTIKSLAKEIGETTYRPVIQAVDQSTETIGKIKRGLDALKNKDVKITINGQSVQSMDEYNKQKLGIGAADPNAPKVTSKNTQGKTIPKDEANGGILKFFSLGGLLKFFANGGMEQHVAQIAPAGAWRMWAEPETGGEAYIPLAKSKRNRSEAILNQVAETFGMKVVKYANGGVNDPLGSRFRPDKEAEKKKADDAKKWSDAVQKNNEEAQKKAEEAKKHLMDVEKFNYEMGNRSVEDHRRFLEQMLGQYAAFSDEWMSIMRDIHALDEERKQQARDVEDEIYNYGAQSLTARISQLQARAAAEKAFSQEWWGIANEIREAQDLLAERGFATGRLSTDGYLQYLRAQQAEASLLSDRWMDINDKINDITDSTMERKFNAGAISSDTYLQFLIQRRNGLEAFTEEWSSLNDQIVDMQAEALNKTVDIWSKFSDKMYVNSTSLIKYLTKTVDQAKKWSGTMDALRASGAYGASTLRALEEMGPGGSGLTNAFYSAIGKGQSGTLAGLLEQATRLGVPVRSYDAGGYLPTGYTLAYNGTGAREAVGGGTIIGLQAETVEVHDGIDAEQLANTAAFAVSRRKL